MNEARAVDAALASPPPHRDGGAWTPSEREDFFAAIERHRRAAWRVSFASGLGAVLLALVMALLLAPLLVCIVGLLVDFVNVVLPLPDVLGQVGRLVDRATSPHPALADWAALLALGSVLGLLPMALAGLALRRALDASLLYTRPEVIGRAPDASMLAEQRLVNVAEEMAIAASIPVPRVRIVPGGVNAAAIGVEEEHAVVLVGEGLVQSLTREQMQGATAQLVASIAGGDLKIGRRAAGTLALFSLMARLATALTGRDAWGEGVGLLRALVLPTPRSVERLVAELVDPLRDGAPQGRPRAQGLTWREWLRMPLMGPVFLACFLGGLVATFVLSPLLALSWRRRKYMADAGAVRLTRDPDALASALTAIDDSARSPALPAWAAHLAIVDTGGRRGSLLSASVISVFPPLSSRARALETMGAQLPRLGDRSSMPPSVDRLMIVAYALCFALAAIAAILLTVLSIMLSMLFTVAPTALLHTILRAFAS